MILSAILWVLDVSSEILQKSICTPGIFRLFLNYQEYILRYRSCINGHYSVWLTLSFLCNLYCYCILFIRSFYILIACGSNRY